MQRSNTFGFVLIVVVSLLTPAPPPEVQELVENVRYPCLDREGG